MLFEPWVQLPIFYFYSEGIQIMEKKNIECQSAFAFAEIVWGVINEDLQITTILHSSTFINNYWFNRGSSFCFHYILHMKSTCYLNIKVCIVLPKEGIWWWKYFEPQLSIDHLVVWQCSNQAVFFYAANKGCSFAHVWNLHWYTWLVLLGFWLI